MSIETTTSESAPEKLFRGTSPTLARIATLVLGTAVGTYMLRYSRTLPAWCFTREWMTLGVASTGWFWEMLTIAVTSWYCARRLSWTEIDGWTGIRWVIVPAITIFAWSFSVYEFNYYLGRWHLVDRALVLVLGGLSLWRPKFLGLFLLQLAIVLGQFSQPLPFSWTDKSLPIDLLVLTQVFLVGRYLNWFRGRDLFVAIVAISAIHYFRPAVGKWQLNWMAVNDLSNLMLAAIHQNGWLTWLSESGRMELVRLTSDNNQLLQVSTLVLELAAVFYLLNRRLLVVLMFLNVGMHAGIFLASGILFWKWILINLGVIGGIWSLPRESTSDLFGVRVTGTLAVVVLAGSIFYTTAPVLAWYDSPLAVHYRIEVRGESGQTYQIPPLRLAPFDLQFAQGRLGSLDSNLQIVDCLGACSRLDLLEACHRVDSYEELTRLRKQFGRLSRVRIPVKDFTQLLRRYLLRRDPEDRVAISILFPFPRPPQHIWTLPQPEEAVWNWSEPARTVRVRRVTVKHHKRLRKILEDEVVLEFEIASPSIRSLTDRRSRSNPDNVADRVSSITQEYFAVH